MAQATFQDALKTAACISLRDKCTVYVNAQVRLSKDDVPYISEYHVSDWHNSDSTIAKFTNGGRQDI